MGPSRAGACYAAPEDDQTEVRLRRSQGAACGNRTHDLRITRTTGGIPGTPTSTDRTSDATESTGSPGRTPTEMPERMPTPARRAPNPSDLAHASPDSRDRPSTAASVGIQRDAVGQ